MPTSDEIIFYSLDADEFSIEIHDDTIWMSIKQMAKFFQRDKSVISRHVKNILDSGESTAASVRKVFTNNSDNGKTSIVHLYNMDVIIAVSYRINSPRGIQFRKWATKILHEYLIKDYVTNDKRLSRQQSDYFEELVARVRRIRTSDANFYEKVKAVFSTSIDYQPGADSAKNFYATVQNKFHFAITGYTAAELIVNRISSGKHDMGLTHRKKAQVTREEAEVAKNYMEELELKRLELLVEQFLSFAELRGVEQKPMYMRDWTRKLDEFIRFNEKEVLTHKGRVSNEAMKSKVKDELAAYNRRLKANPASPKLTETNPTVEPED